GIGLLRPGAPAGRVAALALAVSAAVEVGQLYHAPWIDAIRRTTLGGWPSGTTSSGATWPATPSASGWVCWSSGPACAAGLRRGHRARGIDPALGIEAEGRWDSEGAGPGTKPGAKGWPLVARIARWERYDVAFGLALPVACFAPEFVLPPALGWLPGL